MQDIGKGRFIPEYSGKYKAQEIRKTALVQISNTNKQQMTNDNSNSTSNTARRLSAYQLAMWTKLQRNPKTFKYIQSRPLISAPPGFIPFPTGWDFT
ncbi:hypothetical protein AVEN_133442-1 [Araneus ventricosus]|uniref:Uncharacterized protein n=1 Tax=Araneus ventricosus TaxID=182803 RepID=A0A4Y2TXB9_ARAVE|nr:hypothetical protein AVEN_123226-1 [Araneus ventricosus]GBO05345.1 hypothetical protein AVEN_133442-1 [Araneus ventricosus]